MTCEVRPFAPIATILMVAAALFTKSIEMLGSVVTGGLTMLASNIRGDMTLQIVTDSNVHSISTQVGGQSELESLHRLLTVGQAILSGEQEKQNGTSATQEPKGISTALAELSELHQSGALSDEEFSAAKKKLLGDE